MPSNRVPANQTTRHHTFVRQHRGHGMSILPILFLALGLGGCALNSLGLPPDLPVPPGGGTFTITRNAILPAGKFGITGRTFTVWISTAGGTGTVSSCSVISGTLPATLSIAPSADPPGTSAMSFCKITGTVTSVGPATFNFTVQATDTASPANTASQAYTIDVRPEFAVTPTALPDARQGDLYGNAGQGKTAPLVATTVSATAGAEKGNFPLTTCAFTFSGSSGFVPAPAPTGGNTCPLSSGATPVGAAAAITVTLNATDTVVTDTIGSGNLAGQIIVPSKTNSGAMPLTVTLPVTASFIQVANAVAASTLLDGENGLSYGTINVNAGAPKWSVTGGLAAGAAGVANYSWCVSAGGPTVTARGLGGISTSCVAPTAGVNSVMLTSASAVTGVASFSVDVIDAGNSAVISSTVTQGTSVINVQASLGASFVQGVTSPNIIPNSTLLDGVDSQSYGVINTNAGAPTYTANSGLGAGTAGPAAYQWCVSVGGATVTAIGLSGISTNCGAPTAGSPVLLTSASATAGAASYSVQLTELGNAATPPAAAITLGTSNITVYSPFVASFIQVLNTNPASTLLDGANLRSYGVIGGGAGAPTWTGAGGLGLGSAGLTNYQWCVNAGSASVTATSLSGISTNCLVPTTSATGSVKLTSASATTGVASFTVDGTDKGNEAVPSVTIPQGTSTININGDLTVALRLVPLSPDPTKPAGEAVVGRTYGAPNKANVVYEVTGGLPAYTITPDPTSTLLTGTNIACTAGATTVTCNSANANVTNTFGLNPSLKIDVTDTANTATPAAPAPATKTDVWTVNPAITFSLAPAATGGGPTGTIPDGVVGRPYGTPLADLVFTALGGLGNAVGFGLTGTQTGTLSANNIICAPATAQVGASVTVTCNSTAGGGVVTVPAGAGRTLVMTFSDAGNSTTPGNPFGATSTDNNGYTDYSNTIATPLSVGLQIVPPSPDPTTPDGQAVEGRTYGALAMTDVVYEVTGGLPGYSITPDPTSTLLTGTNIGCTAGATTVTCNSANANVTNTFGLNPSLKIDATDSANVTTPAAAVPATRTDVWTVNPVITFSLVPAATGGGPTGTIPDGVRLRQYGKPLGANDLVFTATGGLANTATKGLKGTATGTFVTDSGLICAPAGAQIGPSVSVTCNSGGIGSALGGTAGAKALVMTFSDVGTLTTPGNPIGATSTDNSGYTDYSNNMADPLAIALQAGSPDPANVNAEAVVGRRYGLNTLGGPEISVVYEASLGLPSILGSSSTYTFVRSGTLLASSNICAVQNTTATTLTCDSNDTDVSGTTGVLTVTVNDTPNATTPSGSAPLPKTYTVHPAVKLTVAPDPALATATAVVGRLYGVPAGLASPTYTAADGLSSYTFTKDPTSTLEANTNIVCTVASPTVTCEEGTTGVTGTGPYPETELFKLTVTDGGNLTTPADAVGASVSKNFTINDVLAITNLTLLNGLKDFTYAPTGPGAPGEILTSTGGIGTLTWVEPGVTAVPPTCPVPTGLLPPGLTLAAGTGVLSGVPTSASFGVTDYNFQVCVQDTENLTTPAGFALPPVDQGPLGGTTDYVINIMDTLAAAAGFGSDTLEVFNTGNTVLPTAPGFYTSVPLTAGDNPFGVAVTPNGRKTYVTAEGNDVVRVVDTIDGSVTTIALGACTGPRGIAMGMPGGAPTAFVACTNRRIAIIDASTDTLTSANTYGTPTATFYGVAITPDDALVYVTDPKAGHDEFVVLDAVTGLELVTSPFPAGVTAPHGVAISSDGARVYIAGSGSDDVIAISTVDNTTVVSTGAASISTGLLSAPEQIAVTPDGSRVYVTLNGTGEFAVFDDSATPAINAGTPLLLAGGAAAAPFGVTIPPLRVVPGTGVRVFIANFANIEIEIRDDGTPFGVNASSPIGLTLLPIPALPQGVAHIPVPR